jgi:hypothetical protein
MQLIETRRDSPHGFEGRWSWCGALLSRRLPLRDAQGCRGRHRRRRSRRYQTSLLTAEWIWSGADWIAWGFGAGRGVRIALKGSARCPRLVGHGDLPASAVHPRRRQEQTGVQRLGLLFFSGGLGALQSAPGTARPAGVPVDGPGAVRRAQSRTEQAGEHRRPAACCSATACWAPPTISAGSSASSPETSNCPVRSCAGTSCVSAAGK